MTQFSRPAPVVLLAIDLDVQATLSIEEREVEVILLDLELGNWSEPGLVKRSVKDVLPLRHPLPNMWSLFLTNRYGITDM